jgi:hypothetical protein
LTVNSLTVEMYIGVTRDRQRELTTILPTYLMDNKRVVVARKNLERIT